MIKFLCWLKVNSIVFQALIDMEISYEEFVTILKEKDKQRRMKESVRNINEKLEKKP